jgi:nucleoside-diphosphate-sugar epimerase
MTTNLHVVLGASGAAGRAIVTALSDRGHDVRAVNRSGDAPAPTGVLQLAADITTPEGAAGAVAGAAVVYMAAQPAYHRWAEEFPAMLTTVLDATADAGAKLVMVDNLYMYGPGESEMTDASVERGGTKKSDLRVRLSELLRSAHDAGRLPVAIGRASDYFGPAGDNSGITALAIGPAVAGKTIRWMGRLDRRHSAAYLPDIGRAYAVLGEASKADGEAWILPHGPAPTGAEFLAAVNAALASPLKTGTVSKGMLRLAAPFHRISRESLEILYQWTEDFVADDAKFQRVFGPFETTPLDQAVEETIEWYRQRAAQ